MSVHYAIQPVCVPSEAVMTYEEVNYMGYAVLACQTEEGYVLERIYSTNPSDFLVPELQPGALLENSLIKKNIR